MMWFQVCLNEEPRSYPIGDNSEIAKFKNPLQNHLANVNPTWHKASLDKGNPFLINERPHSFLSGDNNNTKSTCLYTNSNTEAC